jgi:exosome complex component CSL4
MFLKLKMTDKTTDKIVMPGEPVHTDKKLGTGLYTENSVVYSSIAGRLKEVGDSMVVEPTNPIVEIKKGDTVIASVESVKEKVVLVKIMKVVGKQRTLPTEDYGVVRVMDIAPRYTEKASDEFKIGDVIKAEVMQVLPNDVILTTKGPNLGVIEGYCSYDRGILQMEGEKLVCTICGRSERRKASRDYLLAKNA